MTRTSMHTMNDLLTSEAWRFIENHLPNYGQSDMVAYHDDLQKIVDEEEEDDSEAREILLKDFQDNRFLAMEEKKLVEHELLMDAVTAFMKKMPENPTYRIAKQEIVTFLIRKEKDHRLLSGDLIYQEDLYDLQDKLCDMLARLADDTGMGSLLAGELPYLFKTEKKEKD